MNNYQNRGVALLIAVIFTAVMLAFGILISSLGYKQIVLARSARDSQYAFYAADAALECLLYEDQRQNKFAAAGSYTLTCGGSSFTISMAGTGVLKGESSPIAIGGRYCARVYVQKPEDGIGKTWLFSEGYSVSCALVGSATQYSVRGLKAAY